MIAELLAVATTWQSAPALPVPRTEVAGAAARGEIYVAGGYNADGSSSRRVDVYSPAKQRWRRAPDLPVSVNHAMAAAYRGRFYVVGGYAGDGRTLRATYMLAGGRWRALAPMPASRAAAGAAVAGGRLYVVGGVRRPGLLARVAFAFDLRPGGGRASAGRRLANISPPLLWAARCMRWRAGSPASTRIRRRSRSSRARGGA